MPFKTSEILLCLFLFVIVGFTRVYYGASQGPMFVWKGEFSYKDTFVNLPAFTKIPHAQAVAEHPRVVDQLEDMGLVDGTELQFKPRPHRRLHTPAS